jgi:hypothetical protein
LQAAGSQRAGAIGDTLAAFEELADFRMRLEALEFLIGRQVRVGVAEADDEADGDLVVFQVVEEAAAIGVGSIGQPPL